MRVGLKTPNFYKDKRTLTKGYDYSDIPTLFESDDVGCGELIRFEDNVYSIRMISPANNFALARLVNINKDPEEEVNDDYIKCPVCGSITHDSWEYDEEDEEYSCGNCGAVLSYVSDVTRTFYVNVKEQPKIRNAIPGYAGQQPNNTPKPVMAEVNK